MNGDQNQIWAVVAVKGFGRAKSRLVSSLGRTSSSRLARAMLRDVLDVLGRSERLSGILIVTGDVEAVEIAERYGATVLWDSAEAGTNAAVRLGIGRLSDIGASACVVIHSDVPFVTTGELAAVLDALDHSSAVIVPAHRDGGTNILALSPPDIVDTVFGPDSFARHLAIIKDAGVDVTILPLSGGGHDIDTLDDLDHLPNQEGHTHHILATERAAGVHPHSC